MEQQLAFEWVEKMGIYKVENSVLTLVDSKDAMRASVSALKKVVYWAEKRE